MVFTSRNLDWWCERGILLLVLAIMIFAPLAFGAAYIWTFLVVEALTLGIAALWLVRIWGGHKPKLLWPPLAWAVLAFALYAVGRYLTADVEYAARLELIRVLVYGFLFLAIVSNLYDQDASETIAFTLTTVAALASSYALAQFFHHSNRVWNLMSPYAGRASGTFINPDHFAGFLELVLPLPLAFLMAGRIGVATRVLLGYATLTILGGLAVTLSRGGWVGAGVGVLTVLGFLLCHRNHSLRALVALALLVGTGFVGVHMLANTPGFLRRVAKPDDAGPGVMDYEGRLRPWAAAVHMWRDHPWAGVGPGHFEVRFRQYRPIDFQLNPQHAHNDYLELLADWGTVGGAIVLAGIGALIFGLVRAWPHVRREENDFGSGMSSRYAFFLGAVGGLAGLAVHCLVDFNLHVPADALVAVTIVALLASSVRFASKRYWQRTHLPLQLAMTAVLVCLAAYLAAQGWRRASEAMWTKRAELVQPPYSSAQAATLEKALACEPKNYLTAYNIGECYRLQSLDGGTNYAEMAQSALHYYEIGARLNPYDAYCALREGMCLDWLGQHRTAEKYYAAAEDRDPDGNFVVANIGWHYLQVSDYAAAKQWFARANQLDGRNEMARTSLLQICEPKLVQKASGQLPMALFYGGKDD